MISREVSVRHTMALLNDEEGPAWEYPKNTFRCIACAAELDEIWCPDRVALIGFICRTDTQACRIAAKGTLHWMDVYESVGAFREIFLSIDEITIE